MGETVVKVDGVRPKRRVLSHVVAPLRVLAGATVVVLLYFGLPFEDVEEWSSWAVLTFMVVCFVAVAVWQVRAVLTAGDPRLRAIEALAVSVALLLVGFATVHFVIDHSTDSAYSEGITRLDALYFSITALSTVGFGDITPKSDTARIAVSIQMIINLVVLGVGVRLLARAVERSRGRNVPPADGDTDLRSTTGV